MLADRRPKRRLSPALSEELGSNLTVSQDAGVSSVWNLDQNRAFFLLQSSQAREKALSDFLGLISIFKRITVMILCRASIAASQPASQITVRVCSFDLQNLLQTAEY